MWSKEEAKELRVAFWSGFKHYCYKKHIAHRWVLTGVKIKSVQLKFYADEEKALVMFQIDHKNDLQRYKIYETFLSYRKLMAASCGADLQWEEDYSGFGERPVSAIYFELSGVNMYNPEDHDKIYTFFATKMVLLEEAYWEYRDLIHERLKIE